MAGSKKYVVITSTWPGPQGAVETKHEADKKAPFDALGATVLAHMAKITLNGPKTVIIVDVPEGKLGEYIDHVTGREMIFADAVEGFHFTIDVWSDISGN